MQNRQPTPLPASKKIRRKKIFLQNLLYVPKKISSKIFCGKGRGGYDNTTIFYDTAPLHNIWVTAEIWTFYSQFPVCQSLSIKFTSINPNREWKEIDWRRQIDSTIGWNAIDIKVLKIRHVIFINEVYQHH